MKNKPPKMALAQNITSDASLTTAPATWAHGWAVGTTPQSTPLRVVRQLATKSTWHCSPEANASVQILTATVMRIDKSMTLSATGTPRITSHALQTLSTVVDTGVKPSTEGQRQDGNTTLDASLTT